MRRPDKTLLRAAGQWRLERLRHPRARVLASVASEVRAQTLSEAEREWTARIEAERDRLNASGETIYVRFAEFTGNPADADKVEPETVGSVAAGTSTPYAWALWLFRVVRTIRPELAVELGTSVGISSAYQAAAMRLNELGELHTFDASGDRLRLAGELHERLGLGDIVIRHHGRFTDTLPRFLGSAPRQIDYAFIDGHHDGPATIHYFEMLRPHLAPSAVVVFDDIRWSDGMRQAWASLRAHPSAGLVVDMLSVGVIVIGGPRRVSLAPL
jgi:hypothetical protein